MTPRLLPCTIEDVEKLAHLSRITFSEAFEKDNNPEDFEAYLQHAFDVDKLAHELKNDNSTFFFIHLEDLVVGYLKINMAGAQTDVHDSHALELERIYVLRDFQGRQLGTWALEKVIEMAKGLGKQYVWLGVWEENRKAIAFYHRYGFKKFGEHPYFIGNDKQNDWLMRFDIS